MIESVIGEGASGIVYLARREPEGDRVALKVIHRHLCSDEEVYSRFRREASILKRIQGQHVAQVYELFEETGLLLIALEHVEGRSLEETIRRSPPELEQAVEITLQICAALGAAHAAGVIHRDLKPANVLLERVTAKSSGLRVRVVDFGLAKVVCGEGTGHPATALTQRDMIFGTPEYMSPEQVLGEEIDVRADLYAAGVILYELVVGHVPFQGKSPIATMEAHVREEVPHPRTSRSGQAVAPSLAAVILRALAKKPQDRYPSARAFAEALTAAWGERRVIAPRDSSQMAVSPEELATIDTELNLGEEARAAVKAAEAMKAAAASNAAEDSKAAETSRAAEAMARGIGTMKTLPGTLTAATILEKASREARSPVDPAGTTLRSAPSPIEREGEGPAGGAIRSRSVPDIRIEAPPPRPSGRMFWIVAIVAAAICVVIGVWIGTR